MSQSISNARIALGCAINVGSSVLIVLVNKIVYTKYKFPNMALTCLHFLMTFLGLVICKNLKIFEPKKLPILAMAPLSFTFCGFVVLTNLSLQFNTVGTYQIIKVLTMPIVMIISYVFYSKTYTHKVISTLIPISLGVYLNSYYDIKFSLIGIIFGLVGVSVTSLYQVWIGEKQKQFEVNSMQLLYYQSPMSALILTFIVPFFEPLTGPKGVFSPEWSAEGLFFIFISGVVAFLVNLSSYWIIGTTSAVTYNVIGHLKIVCILIGGFLLFRDPISIEQLFGMLMSIIGVVLYSIFTMKKSPRSSVESVKPLLPLTVNDTKS